MCVCVFAALLPLLSPHKDYNSCVSEVPSALQGWIFIPLYRTRKMNTCDIISTTVFSNRLLEAFLWMLAAFLYHDDPTLLSGGQSYDSVFYPCFHCTGGVFGITAEKRSCCQAGSFQMVLDGGWWDISASSPRFPSWRTASSSSETISGLSEHLGSFRQLF